MDRPQTATINFDDPVSGEPRTTCDEPSMPAAYGATEAALVDPALTARFLQLVSEWNDATAGLSSPRAIAGHDAYQQIIALGPQVLPLLFRDLKENGGWWYPALRALTGVNPVPESARGNLPLNDAAWLKWGQDNGYI